MSAHLQLSPAFQAQIHSDPARKESSHNHQLASADTKLQRLKELYETHFAARLILDHAAGRVRNQVATKIERIITILRNEGRDIIRDEIIDAFRRLEELGAGQLVPGRRGQPSRFLWQTRMVNLGKRAGGVPDEIEDFSVVQRKRVSNRNLLVHNFHLRADIEINFKLPADLTEREVERLTAYLKKLPLDRRA